MKQETRLQSGVRRWSAALMMSTALIVFLPTASALKWAEPSHRVQPDRGLPKWQPSALEVEPEESLNIVGADVMDEMTLGWVKMMRRAYPRLSVTMEARASGSGGPALTEGLAHIATVGRELLPAEEQAFITRHGYPPTVFRVATGSVGSLGKTAASIVMVDRENPVACLSLPQLDAIYAAEPRRGLSPIRTWGDVGVTGEWARRPIHLYGLRHPNGIEWYFRQLVMNGGPYRDDIEFVRGRGHVHAFNVAAEKMADKPGGLTYALMANLQENTRAVPLSFETGGQCVLPTTRTVYDHSYPLSRFVYVFVNVAPGKRIEPKVREFIRAVLSFEGQKQVADDRVYLPLTPEILKAELARLDSLSQ